MWRVKNLPKRENALNANCVLKRKRDEKGAVWKYKARFIICGNEEAGFQEEKFPSVAHYYGSKLILFIAILQEWTARKIAFENKLRNEEIERLVYVKMPAGVSSIRKKNSKTFSIRKSLYGLKAALRIWNKVSLSRLRACELREVNIALCMFGQEISRAVLCRWLNHVWSRRSFRNTVISWAWKAFLSDNLSNPTCFLGLDINWTSKESLELSQEQLNQKLLRKTDTEWSKQVGSPVDDTTLAHSAESELLDEDEL